MTPPVQWGQGAPLRLRLTGALLGQDTSGPTVSGAASRRHTQARAGPLSSGRSPRQGPRVHEGKPTLPGGQHPWKPPLPPGKAAQSSGLRDPPRREGGAHRWWQWAAVSTHCGRIRTPPHTCSPWYCSEAMNGLE